jgi:hypothetical protein
VTGGQLLVFFSFLPSFLPFFPSFQSSSKSLFKEKERIGTTKENAVGSGQMIWKPIAWFYWPGIGQVLEKQMEIILPEIRKELRMGDRCFP